ncbi:Transposase (plasmid) [Roseomonas mucosa]|nr:Transposase [Roseomonas mucosa]
MSSIGSVLLEANRAYRTVQNPGTTSLHGGFPYASVAKAEPTTSSREEPARLCLFEKGLAGAAWGDSSSGCGPERRAARGMIRWRRLVRDYERYDSLIADCSNSH